jgi:hypothetical protein
LTSKQKNPIPLSKSPSTGKAFSVCAQTFAPVGVSGAVRKTVRTFLMQATYRFSEPCPAGCKKLKGGQREWRIRVGDYRVVYTIDDEKLLVR